MTDRMPVCCQNCLQEEAVTEVNGYQVCLDCEAQASLPWYIRD